MRGLQKSKRVSWASDLNLCQVKLFLSDESPSQVGLGGQDHLQAKASWPSQSTGAGSDDNLPPGFEGIQPASLLKNKLSQIPLVEWKCPPEFVLDPTWQVAAGEESKEVELESQREMRVLEAVYPRPSAIPPNPASPVGVDDVYYNDHHTPLIPITPIEDEDVAADTPNTISPPSQPNGMPPPGLVPGIEPDVITAAYSALTAAMSNNGQASLVDPNLLINLLSNPTLIEKLVSTHAAAAAEPLPPFSAAVSTPAAAAYYLPPTTTRAGPVSSLPPPPPPPPVAAEAVNPTPAVKDMNYYKSLIQQHGGEKPPSNPKTKESSKPKVMKPCIYFNSSRGCRHGESCVYRHDDNDSSAQRRRGAGSLPEAKRMKMDNREISGR